MARLCFAYSLELRGAKGLQSSLQVRAYGIQAAEKGCSEAVCNATLGRHEWWNQEQISQGDRRWSMYVYVCTYVCTHVRV